MKRAIVASIAMIVMLSGCGPKNPVAPPPESAPALNSAKTGPNMVPYYEHMYDGEPHRGTDPDLGPTG